MDSKTEIQMERALAALRNAKRIGVGCTIDVHAINRMKPAEVTMYVGGRLSQELARFILAEVAVGRVVDVVQSDVQNKSGVEYNADVVVMSREDHETLLAVIPDLIRAARRDVRL